MRDRFNRDFWMADKGCYCLALEGEGRRRMSVITSNAGQALWTGIADHDKALKTAHRLMQDDMFSRLGRADAVGQGGPLQPACLPARQHLAL